MCCCRCNRSVHTCIRTTYVTICNPTPHPDAHHIAITLTLASRMLSAERATPKDSTSLPMCVAPSCATGLLQSMAAWITRGKTRTYLVGHRYHIRRETQTITRITRGKTRTYLVGHRNHIRRETQTTKRLHHRWKVRSPPLY